LKADFEADEKFEIERAQDLTGDEKKQIKRNLKQMRKDHKNETDNIDKQLSALHPKSIKIESDKYRLEEEMELLKKKIEEEKKNIKIYDQIVIERRLFLKRSQLSKG